MGSISNAHVLTVLDLLYYLWERHNRRWYQCAPFSGVKVLPTTLKPVFTLVTYDACWSVVKIVQLPLPRTALYRAVGIDGSHLRRIVPGL